MPHLDILHLPGEPAPGHYPLATPQAGTPTALLAPGYAKIWADQGKVWSPQHLKMMPLESALQAQGIKEPELSRLVKAARGDTPVKPADEEKERVVTLDEFEAARSAAEELLKDAPQTPEGINKAMEEINKTRIGGFLDYAGVQQYDNNDGPLLDYDDYRHIASEAVDDIRLRGGLIEEYREPAIEYFMLRMGSAWQATENATPETELQFPILTPKAAYEIASEGMEDEDKRLFFAKLPQFEGQITYWEGSLVAFPKAPFIVDPKGPGGRVFGGEQQNLGKYGQALATMIAEGEITDRQLVDPENLSYLIHLKHVGIPSMVAGALGGSFFGRVGHSWAQWLKENEIGQEEGPTTDRVSQSLDVWNKRKGQPGPDDPSTDQIRTMLSGNNDGRFGKAVKQVIIGSGFNTALLDAIDDDVLTDIENKVKLWHADVKSRNPDMSEDEVNRIVADYVVVIGKTALPLTEAKKSHDTNVALAKQFGDNSEKIVEDFIEDLGMEVPEDVRRLMKRGLEKHGADSLTALEGNPNHVVTSAYNKLRDIYNENIGAIADLEQKAAADLTLEERKEEHDKILGGYNSVKNVRAAFLNWETVAGRDLTDVEKQYLAIEMPRLAANFEASGDYGVGKNPPNAVALISNLLGTPTGEYFTGMGAARDWTVGHTEEWVSARGFRVSTNDINNITNDIQASGNVADAQAQIAANIEAGHYEEAFLWEQARTDPEEFVWQHLESTGVITADSSRAFLDHLQDNVIVELADALTIRMSQPKPLEDIKGFVADTIRGTVASFDLDESKFPKTEDDRFFSYDERLPGFPGGPKVGSPSYHLSGPFKGDIVEPSTQRARLSGSELDPALASLYETEDPNFLDFLFPKTEDGWSPRMDELLKGYSYAAVPQVNEEEMRSIANLAYRQRDLQTRARDESRGKPVLKGTGDDPVALASNFVDLTNLQIGHKAAAAATTPGLTPQEYIASMMSGLKKEYADSPLFASAIQQQKSRWSQEAELAEAEARLPKPVRRFPTRFRKVRA
jgi:hypothetical protein